MTFLEPKLFKKTSPNFWKQRQPFQIFNSCCPWRFIHYCFLVFSSINEIIWSFILLVLWGEHFPGRRGNTTPSNNTRNKTTWTDYSKVIPSEIHFWNRHGHHELKIWKGCRCFQKLGLVFLKSSGSKKVKKQLVYLWESKLEIVTPLFQFM